MLCFCTDNIMEIIDNVTLDVGDENISTSIYKLMHSYVVLADLTNHSFTGNRNGDKVKIHLKFKNKHKTYWCQFQCGKKSIEIIGEHTVVFSGFLDNETTSYSAGDDSTSVKAFKLNDSTNLCGFLDEKTKQRIESSSFSEENNVIMVTVFSAHEKGKRVSFLQTDCVDGGGKLVSYNDEENSDIYYSTTDKYYAGSFKARFYIILYKNYKNSIQVY